MILAVSQDAARASKPSSSVCPPPPEGGKDTMKPREAARGSILPPGTPGTPVRLLVGPSQYQVPGTMYGTRYFNPVETGVVPFERYQVLPGISTVP